jgi:integrase
VNLKQSGLSQSADTSGDGLSEKRETGRVMPTINELSVHYLNHIQANKRRYEIDERHLRNHILPRFGQLRLDEVAQSDVTAWLAAKANIEGHPPATVSQLQTILSQMDILAKQWGLPGAGSSAAQGALMFKPRDEREICLTLAEADELIKASRASHNHQLKFIVSLLMLTGVRQRELLDARWAHIDLEQGIWHVPMPNSDKVRDVHLSCATVDVIRELPRWDGCPYLIANPRTMKPYRSFFTSWDTARTQAGLFHIEIDDLRYCGVGEMISAGHQLDFVGMVRGDLGLDTSNASVSAS